MAGSDEEDSAALGTPFEELEDDAPRKKPVPIHDQIVTDSRGRRRFHGAFTGGFSAGYFNTVDTKEGWTPKTFVSSRSQKAAERTTQRPEDFMDEEDLGEFGIAPKRVVTTEKFLPADKEGAPRKRILGPARPSETERSVAGIIQGTEILQDLIVPVRMSIGVKLLTQMGWKEGQGVGPRVRRVAKKTYGCALGKDDDDDIYAVGLLFAPKDVESVEYASKDNLHGIGYSGINPRTALSNQRDWMGLDQGSSTVGIRGKGFGVGALEEDDDDIYGHDNLSNYDIDLNVSKSRKKKDLHGWTGPPQTSEQGGLLSVFTKVSKPPSRKVYPPPVVPRDFVSVHKASAEIQQPTTQTQNLTTHSRSVKLTAKERGKALGETPLPTPTKSVFDYIADEDKTRLKESKEKGKPKQQSRWAGSTTQTASTSASSTASTSASSTASASANKRVFESSGFKPFAKEPDKQARYELFLSGKSCEVKPSGTDCSKMTEWERECEAEEFVRAAELYRPLNHTMASRFISAKELDDPSSSEKESGLKEQKPETSTRIFGAMTRKRFEWHPDRILCKRLNIPDPYPGSEYTGVPSNHKTKTTLDEKLDKEIKAIESGPSTEAQDEQQSKEDKKTSALVAGFQAMAAKTPVSVQESSSSDVSASQEKKKEQNVVENENVIKLAPMDLFKAVFAESSSESESEESEEEEKNEEETTNNTADVNNEESNVESKNENKWEQSNDTKSHQLLSQRENVLSKSPDHCDINTFGPALPSIPAAGPCNLNSRDLQSREKRDRKQKHKQKKKKKEKSKKYKDTDSDDSEYERRRKSKKREKETFSDSSEENVYKVSSKERRKTRSKYSESEGNESEKEYKKLDKHKKKKVKKSKEEKKRKMKKDKNEKHRSKSKFNMDDYEERTVENITTYSTDERKANIENTSSERKQPSKSREGEDDSDSRSINKDIMSKLKNIQLLKEGRRMRAADFM